MQRKNRVRAFVVILGIFILAASSSIYAQPLKTPLDQKILDILSNEISGQTVYNNEVFLAGAPWLRTPEEFTGTFYESEKIYEMAQRYGITTTRLERTDAEGSFEYPVNGEFWIEKPDKRLIAKLEADPALIARGSKSVELTADLVYIPPLSKERIDSLRSGNVKPYEGKVALMWSHVRGNEAAALDSAGLRGVVSFNTRERYFDPGQVVYSRGSYGRGKSLDFGLSVSWRQWSELLEDVESGKPIVVRCKTQIEMFPDKYETVFSWIEGSEPDAKGVVFVAHLFEGYTKRGANDNMSGCVVQLEILRALTKLIREGTIPQPRRNIYFIWPNEIGGTYDFIKHHKDLIDKWSININMDMVGEGLRQNNGVFTMSECPNHLPSYLDGLTASIMNYVWRTNDIVYLPDSPRGRRGGQYFPQPWGE